jgi:hypothetical protein
VITFRFRRRKDGRTSHYLIFVTKHELGCNVMRDVMAGMSSYHDADGVPSFEYDARMRDQPALEKVREGGRLRQLEDTVLEYGAGQTMTVKELFDRHSHCRPYVLANYKEALRQLEAAGKIAVERPPGGRKTWGGRSTMQDEARVTFPRR